MYADINFLTTWKLHFCCSTNLLKPFRLEKAYSFMEHRYVLCTISSGKLTVGVRYNLLAITPNVEIKPFHGINNVSFTTWMLK